ncbi:MAG: hypothetical protein U0992_00630 [Planctomycetaceae bacterium]
MLPQSHLQTRMVVCFGVITMFTSILIGALANRRALDIVENPGSLDEAVARLRVHTFYITLVSLVMGIVYSRMLANSSRRASGSLSKP